MRRFLDRKLLSTNYVYSMKFRLDFIIAAVVLVVIVITSISSSCFDVVPYNSNPMHAYQFSHEGFSGLNYSSVEGDHSNPVSMGNAPLGYTDFSVSGNETTPASNSSIATTAKVEGFEGLQSAPYADEKPIDIYSQNKGAMDCPPNPYSNSRGYLCMSEGEINLLRTRGGNQSTHFGSEIGH
jgi:hypothetical protein